MPQSESSRRDFGGPAPKRQQQISLWKPGPQSQSRRRDFGGPAPTWVPLQRLARLGAWGVHTAQHVATLCSRLTGTFAPGVIVAGIPSWTVLLPAPAGRAPCEKRTSGAARARTIPFVGPRCHSFRPERPRLMQPFMFVATTLRNLILEAVPRCQSRREVGGPAPKLRLHQSARGERKTTATFGKRPTPASPSEKTALEKTGLGWKPLGMLLGCVTSETFGRSGEVQLLEGVGGRFRS